MQRMMNSNRFSGLRESVTSTDYPHGHPLQAIRPRNGATWRPFFGKADSGSLREVPRTTLPILLNVLFGWRMRIPASCSRTVPIRSTGNPSNPSWIPRAITWLGSKMPRPVSGLFLGWASPNAPTVLISMWLFRIGPSDNEAPVSGRKWIKDRRRTFPAVRSGTSR